MKTFFFRFLTVFLISSSFVGCEKKKFQNDTLIFSTSPDYPPFESYDKDGKTLQGFEIELAQHLAKALGKKAVFQVAIFSSLLPALSNASAQAAISTLTITPEREKNFDFSIPYYHESLSLLFSKKSPLSPKDLQGKNIACQMGTTMEFWLKKNAPRTAINLMDSNPQAVEALKSGHVHAVLLDTLQAQHFSQQYPDLDHCFLATSQQGYGIAVNKGSPLKAALDQQIERFKNNGTLKRLQKKWLDKTP